MITARDSLTIQFTRDEIAQTVKRFSSLSETEAREEFALGKDARDWSVGRAQEDLRNHRLSDKCLRKVLYRPFDVRHTFFTGTSRGFIGQPQKRIMAHLDGKKNWALCISRFNRQKSLGYFFASRTLTDFHLLDTVADSMTVFPLYLSAGTAGQGELSLGGENVPNLASEFLVMLSERLKISKRQASGLPTGLTPENIFHSAYAIFHSPSYRQRYAEFLKIDFPRVPTPGSLDLFRELSRLGDELVALHLMESPKLDHSITTYTGPKNPEIARVGWSNDSVLARRRSDEEGTARHARHHRLSRRARDGVEFPHRRLSGLSEMAQGPQRPSAFQRRHRTLSENRRRPERNHPPHDRD